MSDEKKEPLKDGETGSQENETSGERASVPVKEPPRVFEEVENVDFSKPKKTQKKPAPLSSSKKIAYSAAACAIASLASVSTIFLPLSIVPLVVSAFCFFLALVKCGIVHGLVTMAATVLITFFSGSLSVTFFLLLIGFAPYSVICFFLRRFAYRKIKGALFRGAIVVAFVNLVFMLMFVIVQNMFLEGIDILGTINKVGGYYVLAIIVSILGIALDFLFTCIDGVVTKLIK